MRSTHLAASAATACALVAPLLAAAPAWAAGAPPSSAYGIAASGLTTLAPTPAVSSATSPHSKTLTKFPASPVIGMATIQVTANTADHSVASVMYLEVLTPRVPAPPKGVTPAANPAPELPAGLAFAKVVAARCDKGVGTSHVEQVTVAGQKVTVRTSPNSTVTVPILTAGKARVTFNKQVRNADGTLTVTGLELKIVIGAAAETVDIASATCGRPTPSKPSPSTSPSTPPGKAPVPTPVSGDLPVTG